MKLWLMDMMLKFVKSPEELLGKPVKLLRWPKGRR